jgi:hypothetical protein
MMNQANFYSLPACYGTRYRVKSRPGRTAIICSVTLTNRVEFEKIMVVYGIDKALN